MKKLNFFYLIILFCIGFLFIRLNHISSKIEFRYDQGLHLLESYQMWQSHKIRLVGPMVTSKTLDGRQFFIGPFYYYTLALLGYLSAWSPLTLTILFIIIDVIFYLIFLKFLNKHFGLIPTIISAIIITFSPYLISHSRFFWNPHFLIPLSVLFVLFFNNIFIAALIIGLAFSFHYTALFWIIPLIINLFYKKQFNLKNIFIIFSGFILGDLPFFIFELRHQFYNLKTIFLVFFHSGNSSGLTPHYFIFPFLIFTIILILKISKIYKKPFYLLLLLFLFYRPTPSLDQINNWQYQDQQKVTQQILAQGCPQNYNIASTIQGDTRFYDLRYLLTINKCPPASVTDYPNNDLLFLVAPNNRPPETESVWEVTSLKPFRVTNAIQVNQGNILYTIKRL